MIAENSLIVGARIGLWQKPCSHRISGEDIETAPYNAVRLRVVMMIAEGSCAASVSVIVVVRLRLIGRTGINNAKYLSPDFMRGDAVVLTFNDCF